MTLFCSCDGNSTTFCTARPQFFGIRPFLDSPFASASYIPQDVLGLFPKDLRTIVSKSSLARARETATPERNECIRNGHLIPASFIRCPSTEPICAAVIGADPFFGVTVEASISGKRQCSVIFEPMGVRTFTHFPTAWTGLPAG